MKIIINEKIHEFANSSTLPDILEQIGIRNPDGIAIAVNDTIIYKKSWSEYRLVEMDHITIIKALQGG